MNETYIKKTILNKYGNKKNNVLQTTQMKNMTARNSFSNFNFLEAN